MGAEINEWTQGMDRAWWEFQQVLVARLGELGEGEIVSLALQDGSDYAEGCMPYVQFLGFGVDGVLGELSGNRWLAPAYQLGAEDEALLSVLGWRPPEDADDANEANYRFDADQDELDRLAGMAVQAFQVVFGVVHPAFLDWSGPAPDEGDGVDLSDLGLVVSCPTTHEELAVHVDTVLHEIIGNEPWHDGDGDIPVQNGESVAYVRLLEGPLGLEVFSVVVVGLEHEDRALVEVNIINRGLPGPTYAVRGDRIVARRGVGVEPFVADELRAALGEFAEVDSLAGDLITRCGGRRWLAEPVVAPPERRLSIRSRMRTLVQLEADQPGSVSPELAAHVLGHDQRAILEQITRLKREERTTLVPLMRAALRVVVEAGLEQGSPA